MEAGTPPTSTPPRSACFSPTISQTGSPFAKNHRRKRHGEKLVGNKRSMIKSLVAAGIVATEVVSAAPFVTSVLSTSLKPVARFYDTHASQQPAVASVQARAAADDVTLDDSPPLLRRLAAEISSSAAQAELFEAVSFPTERVWPRQVLDSATGANHGGRIGINAQDGQSFAPAATAPPSALSAAVSAQPSTLSSQPTSSKAPSSSMSSSPTSSKESPTASPSASNDRDPKGPFAFLQGPHKGLFILAIVGAGVVALLLLMLIARTLVHCKQRYDEKRGIIPKPLYVGDQRTANLGSRKSLRRALSSMTGRSTGGLVLISVGNEVIAVDPRVAAEYESERAAHWANLHAEKAATDDDGAAVNMQSLLNDDRGHGNASAVTQASFDARNALSRAQAKVQRMASVARGNRPKAASRSPSISSWRQGIVQDGEVQWKEVDDEKYLPMPAQPLHRAPSMGQRLTTGFKALSSRLSMSSRPAPDLDNKTFLPPRKLLSRESLRVRPLPDLPSSVLGPDGVAVPTLTKGSGSWAIAPSIKDDANDHLVEFGSATRSPRDQGARTPKSSAKPANAARAFFRAKASRKSNLPLVPQESLSHERVELSDAPVTLPAKTPPAVKSEEWSNVPLDTTASPSMYAGSVWQSPRLDFAQIRQQHLTIDMPATSAVRSPPAYPRVVSSPATEERTRAIRRGASEARRQSTAGGTYRHTRSGDPILHPDKPMKRSKTMRLSAAEPNRLRCTPSDLEEAIIEPSTLIESSTQRAKAATTKGGPTTPGLRRMTSSTGAASPRVLQARSKAHSKGFSVDI
ncbi:hypothetical protein CBOM_00131 [Ceraceosorus bombacis]|uniref:Uncharacterized protein n=1 Tax=Ceraceosorus bombacis TaxID=401625 RepID=A0A0P1B9T8_9BASI|nr:hypothetical protein CBOM_00131 [Ceraceosorus bombacis]